jgi:hypothetical protein
MTHRPFDNAIRHRVIGVSPYANFLARHLNASGGGAEVGGTRGRSLACKQSCAAPPSGTRGRAPARHAGGMVLTRRDPGGPGRDEGRGRVKRPAVAVAGGRVHPRERYGKAPTVTGRLQRCPPSPKALYPGSWTEFAARLTDGSHYRALAGDAIIQRDRPVRPLWQVPQKPFGHAKPTGDHRKGMQVVPCFLFITGVSIETPSPARRMFHP